MTILDAKLNRRVLTGTGLQVVSRLWGALCSLLALTLIERSLAGDAFGAYFYYWSLFQVANTAADFGTFGISVREASRHPEREADLLRTLVGLRTGLATLGAFAIVLRAWCGAGDPGLLVPIAALHLLALAPASLGVGFHVRVRFLPVAAALMLGTATFLGVTWSLAAPGRSAGTFLVAYGLGQVVQGLVTWVLARRSFGAAGRASLALTRHLLREAWPIGVSALLATLYLWLDTLYLGRGEEAGRYGKAFRLFTFAVMVPTTFCQAVFPVMSRLVVVDRPRLLTVLRRSGAFLVAVAAPAAAITPFLGRQVLEILWRDVDAETASCLKILALATLPVFLAYPHISALTALGHQGVYMGVACVAVPVKFALLRWLFHAYGLPGVAAATLATEILVLTLVMSAVRRYAGGTGSSPLLLRAMVPSVVSGLGAYFVRDWSGGLALLAGLVLVAVGVLLAGVIPLDLAAESDDG